MRPQTPRPSGLREKSVSASSGLLAVPSGYGLVALPCIHPIFLATRLIVGFVRVPQLDFCRFGTGYAANRAADAGAKKGLLPMLLMSKSANRKGVRLCFLFHRRRSQL